jgi:beta-galactosidase
VTDGQSVTFDDSSWRSVTLPHDWSIELAFNSSSPSGSSGGYLDGGIGWYRKAFTLSQASAGKRVLIELDGVYMNSQLWINGTSLGTRPYGYSTFEYDLTPYLKLDGSSNVVAVKVDNKQPNSRFYSGSGIYRNVWLTQVDPIHVPNSGVFVSAVINGSAATVSVATDVQNQSSASAMVTVSSTIVGPNGATVAANDSAATAVAAAATATVQQSLAVSSPQLWSVSSPSLYRVQVELKVAGVTVDTYVTPMGIRSAEFSATTGFSLNGQGMKLHGVNMHHDLGALGAAINYRALERQVEILKGMGVNAIRTSHNPPAPELLEITDRLGVLVLDEAFDTWEQTKTANDYGVYFKDWAQRDIQTMVQRDRNHPSVILWSIGNEVGGATTATATKLKNWVLDMDKTRALTWASNKMGGPHVSEGDDRAVADLLDVAGYNYAPYAGDYDADHKANPGWKLLGTEIAAAVRTRGVYHTPANKVTLATSQSSSDRQCSSYDNEATGFGATAESSYKYDNDRAFVAGSFIWAGFDYIGEPTPYSSWPSKSSYFGAIDTAGFPKDVYYFYKSVWTSEPMVHLLPHWNWSAGTTVTVFAYNNCDSVELFLNDQSQGVKTAIAPALHAEWSVPWASGTLRADCKKGASVVATDTVKTAGAAAKLALSADRNPIDADGQDLVFVTIDVQDENGVFVPTANPSITVSVTGSGQLVGLDNGDPTDTTSYKGTSRKAFNGKALAIVRATGTAGDITISASASGLSAAPLVVSAQAPR